MKFKKLEVKCVPKVWGQELIFQNDATILGDNPPLLIKIIQAKDNLSYQIHPNLDIYPNTQVPGNKDEVWYILSAQDNAQIGLGIKHCQDYHTEFANGNIHNIVLHHQVSAGDFAFIESGTVHMLGAGISVLEIQQNNDITYRLFDYNRNRGLDLDLGLHNLHHHNHSFITRQPIFNFQNSKFQVRKFISHGKIYIDNAHTPYCYLIALDGECQILIDDQLHTLDNQQCYLITQAHVITIFGQGSLILAKPR